MRHYIAAATIVLATICTAPVQAETYRDPSGAFSVEVPAGWTTRPNADTVILVGCPATVFVTVAEGGGANPSLVTQLTERLMGKTRNLRRLGSGQVTVNGLPGEFTMYEGTYHQGGLFVARSVSVPSGDHAGFVLWSVPVADLEKRSPDMLAIERSLIVRNRGASGSGGRREPPQPTYPASQSGQTARGGRTAIARPVPVTPIRGRYCQAYGPSGWVVKGEDAQRFGFDATFERADGSAEIQFHILPAGNIGGMVLPGAETPERAVATTLTVLGTRPITMGKTQLFAPNMFVVPYQVPGFNAVGSAVYTVFPTGQGGYMVAMRFALAIPGRFSEAASVLRSMRCNVPAVPAAANRDLPGPRGGVRRPAPAAEGEADGDSQYNRWLEMEYYHEPRTGENFWVSPSRDYQLDGPEGEGYYIQNGNDVIKLASGWAQ